MISIRKMRSSDIPFAVERTKEEGWHSETDIEFQGFLKFNPDGCFIAESNNRPVGMCVNVPYERSGYFAELIVLPDYRNQRVGQKLIEHSLNYFKKAGIQSVYLDGMPQAVPLYKRCGFKVVQRSARWQGKVIHHPTPRVRGMLSADLPILFELDKQLFGEDRSFFLNHLFENNGDLCKIILNEDKICGYIIARDRKDEISVGPWMCNSGPEDAKALLTSLSKKTEDKPVRMGIYKDQSEAMTLARTLKLAHRENSPWHMVWGEDIRLGQSESLYAIGSAAKG